MSFSILPPFGWRAPTSSCGFGTVYQDVNPNFGGFSVQHRYKHDGSRLGASASLEIGESDDDTFVVTTVTSELVLTIGRAALMDLVGAARRNTAIVEATFELVTSRFNQIRIEDELGGSSMKVEWSTRPFCRVEGDYRQMNYASDINGLIAVDASDTALKVIAPTRQPRPVETVDLKIDKIQDIAREMSGESFSFSVGLEEYMKAASDDYSYRVGYDSEWLLQRVEVSIP